MPFDANVGGQLRRRKHDTVVTGQLKVDIADVKAKQFLWRGTATDTVTSDPQKLAKKIDKALTKMFQKFPTGQ